MEIFRAISAGEELANPEVWKNRTVTTNLVLIMLTFCASAARMFGMDLPISDDMLTAAAEIIASCFGLGNIIMIYATSKKVGL